MTGEVSTILEGIDENTPRHEMLKQLRELGAKLHGREDARLANLQAIEERVRKEYAGSQQPLIQVIVTSSEAEWNSAVDFLDNFEDLLPVALFRLHDGVKGALGRNETKEAV